MKLKGRVAVVTGAAGGIGFATAALFAAEGARVALCDQLPEVKGCANRLKASDYNVEGYQFNVTQRSEVEERFASIEADFKAGIDILVNVAGIVRDDCIQDMSDADWDEVLAVNLKGTFLCGREAIRRILAREPTSRSGVILNTSSITGVRGPSRQSNYAASKAGIIALTEVWAKELGPHGIRVNSVAPGFTQTPMLEGVTAAKLEEIVSATPLRRLGKPGDLAKAFLFLASDDSSFITGQTLCVDGGLYC